MKIAVIGLGYVGLPLAAEFAKKYDVIGFDINTKRVEELQNGYDRTLELSNEQLKEAKGLSFSTNSDDIKSANIYIITVPTPIDDHKNPDLTPLIKASQTVGKVLKKDDIVIYESTVYPGCTEEVCVPVLEQFSSLVFNKDFFCGYSPERINPGDKEHTVSKILKVTSGSTPEIATKVDDLYRSIITAGTYKASSLKVAEAAKVIENTQRDINIAFINELALIFAKMGIDTTEVLEAAGTKWNFLPFKPGLVGGHCIGVDPYYLTYKAESLGYHPQTILSGRRINDGMGAFVASQTIKLLIKKGHKIEGAKALVLGLTFKEDCPDIRNSKVIDIINELKEFGVDVKAYDPWVDKDEVIHEYKGIDLINSINGVKFDAVIVAVGHREFKQLKPSDLINSNGIIYDVKGIFNKQEVDARL